MLMMLGPWGDKVAPKPQGSPEPKPEFGPGAVVEAVGHGGHAIAQRYPGFVVAEVGV